MTPEQEIELLAKLERIAVALEPKRSGRPDPGVPPRGGRRVQTETLIEEKIKALVKTTALKPTP